MEHISLDAVKNLLFLCNREDKEIGTASSELVTAAFRKLSESEKVELVHQITTDDGNDIYLRLSVTLLASVKINYSRQALMRLVPNEVHGVAALEALKSFPPPTVTDLQIMYDQCDHSTALLLRVLDLGAHFEFTQTWSAYKLKIVINGLAADPLALVNVLELITSLPNSILTDSIDDLHSMCNDPIFRAMDIILAYFLRLFTKYFANTSVALPNWYIELLFSEDIPIELFLNSTKYIFGLRPDLEMQFRNTKLGEIISVNSTRHLIDLAVMEVLGTILEGSQNEDSFAQWFPRGLGRHLIICSNDPDKNKREIALECISACAKYPTAVGYFGNVTDFANLLQGPGCNDSRSKACRRFATHDNFAPLCGEELKERWTTSRYESNFPDPQVAVESMQM